MTPKEQPEEKQSTSNGQEYRGLGVPEWQADQNAPPPQPNLSTPDSDVVNPKEQWMEDFDAVWWHEVEQYLDRDNADINNSAIDRENVVTFIKSQLERARREERERGLEALENCRPLVNATTAGAMAIDVIARVSNKIDDEIDRLTNHNSPTQ